MSGRKRRTPLLEHHYLTPDLWREVLLRLPAKTLLRFRCVCKTWCSFIDSSDFISMHLKIFKNNSANSYLLSAEPIPKTICDCNFKIRRSDTIRKTGQLVKFTDYTLFMCSDMIDGLLLMECSDPNHVNPKELRIWNPSIRKSVLLPSCSLDSSSLWNPAIVRYFKLGFDFSSNDYKVLGLQPGDYRDSELSIDIAIYSLRDHCWRVKPKWINAPKCWFELVKSRNGAVFCQGALYWRPYSWFFGNGDGVYTHLLSFDFVAEEFSYVKMPDIEEDMIRFIFILGGSLALLGISRVRSCVWVLEKKNAGKELWRVFSSGDSKLDDAYEIFDNSGGLNLQMMYVKDSGTLLVHNFNKLMFYNITGHQIQKIRYFRCSYLKNYVESLVLHKGYEAATSTTLTQERNQDKMDATE